MAEDERPGITEEQIAANFSAMTAMVDLINTTVADDSEALKQVSAAQVKEMIACNVDALENHASRDWYADSALSKAGHADAVATGKAYVAG